MQTCMLCLRKKERTRRIDLYVWGSEGMRTCHECEMKLVAVCTEMALVAYRKLNAEDDERRAEQQRR